MEDLQAFMVRCIRTRAVAPIRPGLPALSPLERRSWWEFCLGMAEFLAGLIRDRVVSSEVAHQLSRLQWIAIKGTYLFNMRDPELHGEQRRCVELCVIIAAVFAVVVDDNEGIRDVCDDAFGPDRCWSDGDSKLPAVAEALVENRLRGWKDWEHASSPIRWVLAVAESLHDGHCPRAMEEEPTMTSLDASSPTGDPYVALLPDPRGDEVISDIHARVDLITACDSEGLAPETSLLALSRYNRVPLSVAIELLGLSKHSLAAASRELIGAMPALQRRLSPYRENRKQKVKHI